MNLDTMNEIQRQGGRFWNVSTVAELFDSPLPVCRQRLWDQIALFAKRVFLAHRNH